MTTTTKNNELNTPPAGAAEMPSPKEACIFLSDYASWLLGCGATCIRIEKNVRRMAGRWNMEPEMTIHDFRVVEGPTHTNVIFDAVVPFGFRLTDKEVEEKIRKAVRALDGNYYAVVNVERSYT